MIDGHVLLTGPGVPPDVLVDADHRAPVEAVRVVDQKASALGQDRLVGGVPGHPEIGRHRGHREVLAHDALQRPGEPGPGEPRPRLGRESGVLPPDMPALAAPVTAHPHQQGRGPTPEGHVGEPADHRVPGHPVPAALMAPLVRRDHPTADHRLLPAHALAGRFQTELVKTGEGVQIGRVEGSVVHVEALRSEEKI
jgi:hypothetical protein